MSGKCRDCGKKATQEYLIRNYGAAWTVKYCDKHAPKLEYKEIQRIA